jgi:hypothetical protein
VFGAACDPPRLRSAFAAPVGAVGPDSGHASCCIPYQLPALPATPRNWGSQFAGCRCPP